MSNIEICLTNYSKIDEAMAAVRNQMKELKVQEKELSEMILTHMERNETDVINHDKSQCVFKRMLKKSKGGLNKETIQESMSGMFNDPGFKSCKNDDSRAELGADFIMNNRKETEKYVLKRKSIKQKSS